MNSYVIFMSGIAHCRLRKMCVCPVHAAEYRIQSDLNGGVSLSSPGRRSIRGDFYLFREHLSPATS